MNIVVYKLDEWLPRSGINLPSAQNEGQQGGQQISNGCATKTQQALSRERKFNLFETD